MNIKIENLTKKYGTQKAVDAISFEVKTGEILGFLGPNGAGKTTTMKMITNYISIGGGDIKIGDKSVRNHADSLKKYIGYLPEHNPLYLDMPVMDYLKFCAQLQGIQGVDAEVRMREMIRACGLNKEKHKKINELSKGYRQRVGLAQAMIHDPEILILDEPTTGLDPNQIIEIRKLIRRIGQTKTVILSTHILPEVEAICDRILIIKQGKIVADGTAETLRKQAQGQEILRVRIEESNLEKIQFELEKLPSIGVVKVLDETQNIFEIHSQNGDSSKRAIFEMCVKNQFVLTESVPLETKLEDIFRDLTT